jgi:hypothetical protein
LKHGHDVALYAKIYSGNKVIKRAHGGLRKPKRNR